MASPRDLRIDCCACDCGPGLFENRDACHCNHCSDQRCDCFRADRVQAIPFQAHNGGRCVYRLGGFLPPGRSQGISISHYDRGRQEDGAAANDSHERGCERRRLGADAYRRRLRFCGSRCNPLDRSRRHGCRSEISKRGDREKRRRSCQTRCLSGRS